MKKKNGFKEIISGSNGRLSSKRVMGIIILVVCIICTCYLVWTEGGTQIVENLLQTLMVMAAALLGISSVTGIWKKNETTLTNTNEHKIPESEDPCSSCIHNKKETE